MCDSLDVAANRVAQSQKILKPIERLGARTPTQGDGQRTESIDIATGNKL
jgi:hypothetical protein